LTLAPKRLSRKNELPFYISDAPGLATGRALCRGAGRKRNTVMAEAADALIAVYDGASRGTADMIRKAKARGLAVCAVITDPTIRAVRAVHHTPPSRWPGNLS
jgi:hypothetical protein